MNILMISRGYPSKWDPQWGSFEKEQAIALKNSGNNVIIAYVDRRVFCKNRKWGISKIDDNGIIVYSIYIFPLPLQYLFFVTSFFTKIFFQILVERIIKENDKIDLIYSHYLYNTYFASFIKIKHKLPLVCIEHWSGVNKDVLPQYVKLMGAKAYSTADAIIAVCDSLRKRIREHFNKESFVVHNMVSDDFFTCPLIEKNDFFQFVSVGTLIKGKGYDFLINSFSQTQFPEKTWKLLIVGDGPERDNLYKQITHLGLENHIFLLGKKSKNDIVSILAKSHAFILPSRGENFSVAIIEALSIGIPVVATDCGGTKESINSSNGILVPVDDTSSMSESLLYMFNNILKYNASDIRKNSKERYSSSVIGNQLLAIFDNVLYRKDNCGC